MVAVFNKELLSWYLITVKLRETVESGIATTPTSTNRSIELPEQAHQQVQKQEQQPSPLQVVIQNGADKKYEDGPKSPDSEWVINIKDKLEQAGQDDAAGTWAKLCIYRVPHYLREGDDKAIVPQIVSLGPYHHGRRRLRQMDRHKWRSLHHMLKPEGFKQLGYPRNDPIFAMRGSMHSIQRDMIMLENQLPLFILDRLLGLQFGDPEQKGLVAKLALRFFDPLMPTDEPLTKSDRNKLESSLGYANTFDPLSDQGGLHCLDVFRRSLLRRGLQPTPRVWIKKWSHVNRVADKRRQQLIHCVTELREAGIKFKKRKTDRFWDVKFKNGILSIPRLLIHDGTKSLFLNLIAFEQCHLDCSNDITSYVIFMDNLINSPQDVGYLHYCGIIEHWLGSDAEVADLFNRLCQEVVFDINDSYLSRLSEDVNRYYNHRWNAWRASLKHNYFNNPWATLSFVAAVVLLFLTFAQTFYGVYGYYRPPN
ncbi:hypothetical protein GBA52_019673 [Prunus armeniaca]|nr:hypothetical protein GBA52_019673 [Prunus armeniaca]